MKNVIVETILKLLVSYLETGFKWIADYFEETESELDDFLFEMLCFASQTDYGIKQLKAIVEKSETKIDDEALKKWLKFADAFINGDNIELEEAAEKLGFVGLIK
jgi:hypothetical protein